VSAESGVGLDRWGRLVRPIRGPARWLRRRVVAAVALLLIPLAFLGGMYADQRYPDALPVVVLPGQPAGQADRASVDQALRIIQADYYDPNVDSRKLSDASLQSLVRSLGDPYSRYLDPQQYRDQQEAYAGQHRGVIGVTLDFQAPYPVVTSVLPDSPALRAGLRTDDVILRAAGRDLRGMGSDRVSALIRGQVGSEVTLVVRQGAAERTVAVRRGDFQSPTVLSADLGGGVAYIRVYQFGDHTAQEFDAQLAARLPRARGVVLDLRDDGGGYVNAAGAVISRFVASGEAFEERGRTGTPTTTFVDGNHPAAAVPLVVLVNGGTASAAEMVAGSLQAHGRAKLVGSRTFGKGSVQSDFELAGGGDLHLTVEHWFLPGGRSIDGRGLSPDVTVGLPSRSAMFDVVQPGRGHAQDLQLNRALELLPGPG
jgi:carboxyl-terminal processing protease